MLEALDIAITLVDRDAALVAAWQQGFAGRARVTTRQGDYFGQPADAMVSPANSFGFMDGGLDLAIRAELGVEIERRVQARLRETHHGEIPVGCAEIVPTGDTRWPHLIVAPTMRVPGSIAGTANAYLAFRAVLLAIAKHAGAIRSLVCPGLGTGVGGLDPSRCAHQMVAAYDSMASPARTPRAREVLAGHFDLIAGRRG